MVDTLVKVPDGYLAPFFTWDETKTSKKISLTDIGITATVIEGSGFKTVLGNTAFIAGGKYYFEIYIHKGSLIKIGVSRGDINIEEAFSDTANGWAIYHGELRHNSNSSGSKYGELFGSGDTIGVMIDMIEGILSFSKNGINWGIAFRSEELKNGKLYAACSPIYNGDSLSLKMLIPEDQDELQSCIKQTP